MNTNAAQKTNETALLDRKLKLMDQLRCRELIVEIEGVDERIIARLGEQAELQQQLAAAQAELSDAEALVALTVEGKNDVERKARRVAALRDDPAYEVAAGSAQALDQQLSAVAVDIESLKRRHRRAERQIEYRVACLRFLGG